MSNSEQTLTVSHQNLDMNLAVCRPAAAQEQRPAVLVSHAWAGQTDFERGKAAALAELGYVGVALDLYGGGRTGNSKEENSALMQPLLEDRAELRARLLASLQAVRGLDGVDGSRVAAIGFCFGGLCVLDLARSGADVAGVVSIHGLFGAPDLETAAVSAKVLCLHGWDDPMVPPEQVLGLAAELSAAGADWQLHAYGGTMHAFTNPEANDPDFGTVFSATANRRAWAAVKDFLSEVLA